MQQKTRWILSQQEKQSVAVRPMTYYGKFIYADEVIGMTIFDGVVQRRGKSLERGIRLD
jgi:hypothetical protein